MTVDKEILVLGATGKTGRRVVSRLRDAGARVRAASPSGEIPFDWYNQDTWTTALEDVGAVYMVAPDDPTPIEAFVHHAATAGVERVVLLSGRGIDLEDGSGMATAENAVRASGLSWAVLRASSFDQNFDEGMWQPALQAGLLALPIGDQPESFLDLDDLAEAAASILTDGGHDSQTYELTGPQALSFRDVVATVSRFTGKRIDFTEINSDQYREELIAQGYPAEAADALNALFVALRSDSTAEPTDDVRRILGREATTFESYADRAAATGVWH